MDIKYLKSVALYILSAIISVCVIFYIIYHLTGGFDTDIETTVSALASQQETIIMEAYIMRNETPVYSMHYGDINFLYRDGEKVGINTDVADIYASGGSDEVRSRIIEIDNKIRLLQSSNLSENMHRTDTKSTDSKLWQLYYLITGKIENGDISYALQKRDDMLILLNRRNIIVHTVTDYNSQISRLLEERERLTSQLNDIIETVKTSSSGYFYSVVDGYEDIFNSSRIDSMNYDDYRSMINSEPSTNIQSDKGYEIGKLVTDYVWYITCEVNESDLHYFETTSVYPVIFPYNSDTTINMTLYRVITEPDTDTAVLIFKTGIAPEYFKYLRMQTVEIVRKTYIGYRVPVSAVRIVNGEQGVYILNGNTVEFKKITPLIESEGFLIVAEQSEAGEDRAGYLGINEAIITTGKDLYDGKIIK